MTKIFALSGYISDLNRCSWGMGKGIFLQHSEGRGYLDTDHCHRERLLWRINLRCLYFCECYILDNSIPI